MRIKTWPKYTKILVQWTDIVSDSSWHDGAGIDKAHTAPIQTIGFFLQNKKKTLKVAHSVTDDGESDYTCIPWSVVSKIVELTETP